MPATKFVCPNGQEVAIETCLENCPNKTRCMFLPTLRAIAKSSDRKLDEPTVTELLVGCREIYLKKTSDYAVNPQQTLYALYGQAIHTINEGHTDGDILAEIRLHNDTTSGKFDMYGKILDEDEGVLGDLKVTSSYKIMKALGYYKKSVPTGEVYKTGPKKGQPKFRQELFKDGVKHVLEWAIQLNYYRMLLEAEGFTVNRMYIQAMCRDTNLRIAAERGIDQTVYVIPINKISDRWMVRYFSFKSRKLKNALKAKELPPVCSDKERWHDRKCLDYCDVGSICPYGARLRQEQMAKAG